MEYQVKFTSLHTQMTAGLCTKLHSPVPCSTFAPGFNTMCSWWVSLSQSMCPCCLLTMHLEVCASRMFSYRHDEQACHLHPIVCTLDQPPFSFHLGCGYAQKTKLCLTQIRHFWSGMSSTSLCAQLHVFAHWQHVMVTIATIDDLQTKDSCMKTVAQRDGAFEELRSIFWIRQATWLHSVHEIAVPNSWSPQTLHNN